MSAYRAVVVGAGVIGCSVAYQLARRGVRVCLVERGAICSGTSSACDGGLLLQTKKPGLHLDLARASLALFPQLAEELPGDFEYQRASAMLVSRDAATRAAMESFVAEQRAAGLAVRLLSPPEVRELEPALQGELEAATYLDPADGPTDGMVNPPYLAHALARGAVALGAEIRAGEPVVAIERQAGQVTAVRTTTSRLPCEQLVLAAGAWTPELTRLVGLEVPIRPRRGQIVITECLPPLVGRFVLDAAYVALKYDPGLLAGRSGDRLPVPLALEQSRAGSLLLGSTREYVGYDRRTWPSAIASILRAATDLIPALRRARVNRTFAGLRPSTPDGLPILGPVDEAPGLFLAAGHEGDGIALSAITGQLVAQAMVGDPTDLPLDGLLLRRFGAASPAQV